MILRFSKAFLSTVLRFLLTGIATILPLAVTIFLVTWLMRVTDQYIGPSSSLGVFLANLFQRIDAPVPGFVVGYAIIILLIILLGFLVTRATVSKIHKAFDAMWSRIPLIGKIYTAVGQVVELLGKRENAGLERFGGVAQIKVGNVKMVALLTSGHRYRLPDGREHLLVFVPNSPIPATGFNVLVPVEDVNILDMPIEDLVKMMMSLGLLGQQVLPQPLDKLMTREDLDDRKAS